jgi:hypothetical protein
MPRVSLIIHIIAYSALAYASVTGGMMLLGGATMYEQVRRDFDGTKSKRDGLSIIGATLCLTFMPPIGFMAGLFPMLWPDIIRHAIKLWWK